MQYSTIALLQKLWGADMQNADIQFWKIVHNFNPMGQFTYL